MTALEVFDVDDFDKVFWNTKSTKANFGTLNLQKLILNYATGRSQAKAEDVTVVSCTWCKFSELQKRTPSSAKSPPSTVTLDFCFLK